MDNLKQFEINGHLDILSDILTRHEDDCKCIMNGHKFIRKIKGLIAIEVSKGNS